jgi:hypothetical protein
VEEKTRSEEGATVVLDDEKCGDILHVEKEDVRSETSGAVSVSEMESALAEFEHIKCVGLLPPSPIHKP